MGINKPSGENAKFIAIIAFLSLLVFTLDIVTPISMLVGLFYIPVVLISLKLRDIRVTRYIALSSMLLTFIAFIGNLIFDNGVPSQWINGVNVAFVYLAIIATSYLGILLKDAEKKVQRIEDLPKENPNPIMRISHDYIIQYANYAAFELINNASIEDVANEYPQKWDQTIDSVLKNGKPIEIEFKSNKQIISLNFTPVPGSDYVNVYGMDVTKRKLQEIKMQKLSMLDSLTGIANRRKFKKQIDDEWERAKRNGSPLSMLLLDIDYFKRYNDTYGHQAGDDTLVKVAQTLSKICKRPGDLVARYGGEEFVIILSDTTLEGAIKIAEKAKEAIEKKKIVHRKSAVSEYITMSIGVASVIPTAKLSHKEVLNSADKVLYVAKRNGRNRIEFSKNMIKAS